jgi:ferric-dicitrate binding protein FerR (iron transport regulator)
MTDRNGHNNGVQPDFEKIAVQFPLQEREHVKRIWKKCARAKVKQTDITHDEVESALTEVHKRIERKQEIESDSPTRIYNWRWILAAATVLLVFGAGLFFVPKTVNAPYGEIANVTLPDGSEVELNSGSEIHYNRLFSLSNRKVSLNGEAFFSVQKGSLPFEVSANGSTVRVTGTKFNVRSWREDPGKETEVSVVEGSVRFYPENNLNRSVTIQPGQLSRLTTAIEKPTAPDSVSIDRIVAWRDHKFVFNEKPLIVVFRELERRFDMEIDLEAETMRNETVTTFYASAKSVETILKDICRVKGLSYAETANGYRVYR